MIPNRLVILLSILILCATACKKDTAGSKTLTEFSNSADKVLSGLYFYPTTIRMLAKMFGSEDGAGFSDVKSARVFFSLNDDDPELIKTVFTKLQKGVKDEGFEILVQIKSPESNIHVYLNDGDIPDYVFFIRGDSGDLIAELNGHLSEENIREIMQMDLSEAAKMFDLIPVQTKQQTDSLHIAVPQQTDQP